MANIAKDPELAAEEIDAVKFSALTDEEKNIEWDKKLPITGNQTGKWCAIMEFRPRPGDKMHALRTISTPFT